MRYATVCVVACVPLAACEVGPDYMRPPADVPMAYKEIQGWMPAAPREAAGWENWWAVYNDPVLDALEKQVDINNQNLIAAEAAYRVARAQVGIERGQLLPTIDASAGARGSGNFGSGTTTAASGTGTGSGTASGTSGTGATGRSSVTYSAGLNASWDLDV